MNWIGFSIVMIALVAAVVAVFGRPRRKKRDSKTTTPGVRVEAPTSEARAIAPKASVPPPNRVVPAPSPSELEELPDSDESPHVSRRPAASSEIPDLFTFDRDEPLTIVTRRFKPNPLQSYIDAGDLEDDGSSLPFGFLVIAAVAKSDVGRRRKHNEDSFLVFPDEHLFAVADGMGGHAAGEVASNIAVMTILNAFEQRKFEGTHNKSRPRRADELVRAIEMANKAIFTEASSVEECAGMGTTVVAVRFAPTRQRVFIAHVGDSRCYRLRNGQLVQMTVDHTMSAYGVKGREGEKLTRAVGIAEEIEVDVIEDTPETGDQYLVSSDGLTKMLDDATIAALLGETQDPEMSVRRLVEAANERGGRDNITAIVIQVHATSP